MITKQIIDAIYKKYNRLPKSIDCLDMSLLFEYVADIHHIRIDLDSNRLTIGSIDPLSPFHCIPLDRIHAIVPFDEWIAIVLPAAIIFLNKKSTKVSIHLKPHKPSLWDRIRGIGNDEK